MKIVLHVNKNPEVPPIFIFEKFTTVAAVSLTDYDKNQIRKYYKLRDVDIGDFRSITKHTNCLHEVKFIKNDVGAMKYYSKHFIETKYKLDYKCFDNYIFNSDLMNLCTNEEIDGLLYVGRSVNIFHPLSYDEFVTCHNIAKAAKIAGSLDIVKEQINDYFCYREPSMLQSLIDVWLC